MDGVTILNTVYEQSIPEWLIAFVAICSFMALLFSLFSLFEVEVVPFCISASIFVIGILSIIIVSFVSENTNKIDYQEVIISDSVNLNEFMEQYEIKDQRGDIYKVELKENEE